MFSHSISLDKCHHHGILARVAYVVDVVGRHESHASNKEQVVVGLGTIYCYNYCIPNYEAPLRGVVGRGEDQDV